MKIPILSRTLPFLLSMFFLALADLLAGPGYSPFTASELRWLYPVKITAVALALLWLSKNYTELARPLDVPFSQWLWAAAFGAAVYALWINLDLGWLRFGSPGGFNPEIEGGKGEVDWRLAGMRLLGATLIVPIMEELFWRSFLMRWIDRENFLSIEPSMTSTRSLVATSVLFGFTHHLWLAGIIAGLAYGWLYRRCNNLWAPVAAHALTNGMLGIWVLQTGNWRFW